MSKNWPKFIKIGLPLLVAVLVLLFPLWSNQYQIYIAILIFINALLGLSLRLIMNTGQVSFGHAAFFALGAYGSGLLVLKTGIPFWLGFPVAGLISATAGLLIGLPTLRLRGVYFFLVTFAFGEVLRLLAKHWSGFTGGDAGIRNIPSPEGVASQVDYFYFGAILLILVFIFLYRLDRSRTGKVFLAIDQQTQLAEGLGINTMGYKVFAFTLACFIAGLTGSFYVHFMHTFGPAIWDFHRSVEILMYVVIGGATSIWGPVLGAALLTITTEVFQFAQNWAIIGYAAVLIVVVMFFPQGIVGIPRALLGLIRRLQGSSNNR